jgi:hypothetical protein
MSALATIKEALESGQMFHEGLEALAQVEANIASYRAEARQLRDLLARCSDDRQRYYDALTNAADNLLARVQAELIMRDNARRDGWLDTATMHGDRAQAFNEAAAAVLAMRVEQIEAKVT